MALACPQLGIGVNNRRIERSQTNVLYLSNTPILGGTSRMLQYWLQTAATDDLRGCIVLRRGSHFIEWARDRSVRMIVDPMPWPNRWAPWSVAWHAMRVARWARRANVQLIHCNEHDVYPFARMVKRILKLPIVCHVRYKLERGFAEWAFRGRRAPDALLWTSHRQKLDSADAIAGIVPEDRQHVVRLGVDLDDMERHREAGRRIRANWGIRDHELLIGLPSPLRPRKRIEDFITLIMRLSGRHENIVGIIAGQEVPGDEKYRARIEQLIANSGLGRRLRWVGYLSPVEPFHHACDISVSTSEYETFGNSICEAMACGKPVAAYRGGSVAEVVGETGLIVETGDIDALTNAVERLSWDGELRSMLGAAARQRVATEFNPAISLKQLKDIYQSLLSTHELSAR